MYTFSSYTNVSEVRCPGAPDPALLAVATNERLRQINWLLNSYYNPQLGLYDTPCVLPETVGVGWYQNSAPTYPGTYGVPPNHINKNDMQAALWYLTGGCHRGMCHDVMCSDMTGIQAAAMYLLC